MEVLVNGSAAWQQADWEMQLTRVGERSEGKEMGNICWKPRLFVYICVDWINDLKDEESWATALVETLRVKRTFVRVGKEREVGKKKSGEPLRTYFN